MTRIGITLSIVLCAQPAFADTNANTAAASSPPASDAAARFATISHEPLNEVPEGEVRLHFELESPDLAGVIVARIMPEQGRRTAAERRRDANSGARASFETRATRVASGFEARIAAGKIAAPGFSYFVVERMPDKSERPVFATASAPHRVRVVRPAAVEAELEQLAARDGQRSTVLLSGEWVDFGDRRLSAQSPLSHDQYYRLEAGYGFSFLTLVEDVQLSLVRVRGRAASYEAQAAGAISLATEPGIDYGRAAVSLHLADFLRIRGSVLLGASQLGFEYGGGAAIILGDPRDMNLETGVEGMTTLGVTGRLRLGFLASERLPMGASIEVTTFPLGDDAGVRLLYDVGYRFGAVTTLTLRGGYQGRTSVRGGPSAMLSFTCGF